MPNNLSKTVVFAANRGYALKSSREKIIQHFISQGWQVVIATSDDIESRDLCISGAVLESVTFGRGGFSPRTDIQAYQRLKEIYRTYRPALVHHFHAKPVILGTVTARRILGDDVTIVNSITGLGHAFVSGGWIAYLAGAGYRLSLPKSDMTIFQNRDDQSLFICRGWVRSDYQRLIVGSGVDIKKFSLQVREHERSPPVIIMLGRLLKQKGILEFIEVAKRVRKDWPTARFIWAGEVDSVHPDAVTKKWIMSQIDIEYVGRLSDILPLLNSADILLFPSYREGVPRAVMEAAATGLPTVGFDVPGVREAVRDGETGYLVPKCDVDAMTESVVSLLENVKLLERMGRQARQLAESEFDVRNIQTAFFSIYCDLGIDISVPESKLL
nr:glycosyltransferase family 4 protein [uncultured Halomonas sp.]